VPSLRRERSERFAGIFDGSLTRMMSAGRLKIPRADFE